MTHETVSVIAGGSGGTVGERTYDNRKNLVSPCDAYQYLRATSTADVIAYIHDDVTVHESDWKSRVMSLFDNPSCVVVGLGGATSLGHPCLYKRPYQINDMARGNYCSNQTDAEVHGTRFTGAKRVAVVDAFFMAVRREWLSSIGGWPVLQLTFHCLDLWICLEAARAGKEVWMTGISCTHHGGGTSTKESYQDASWLKGGTRDSDHAIPHLWLYREYGDVLPLEVR